MRANKDFCTSITTIFLTTVFNLSCKHCREKDSCSVPLYNNTPSAKDMDFFIRYMICITDNQYFIICRQAPLSNKLVWNASCALQREALLSRKQKHLSYCQTYHMLAKDMFLLSRCVQLTYPSPCNFLPHLFDLLFKLATVFKSRVLVSTYKN